MTDQEVLNMTQEQWGLMHHVEVNAILSNTSLMTRLKAMKNFSTSRVPFDYWIKKSKAELIQWYMNAVTTYARAMGHGKAERNSRAVDKYASLLKEYEVPIPSNDLCYIMGVFNGEGSC